MFALINTNGATHIAINVPHDVASTSLAQLSLMLEKNAVFINKGWRELSIRKPEMTIHLGGTLEVEADDSGTLLIDASKDNVLDASFVIAEPDVFVSFKEAIAKKDKEIERQRAEVSHMRNQIETLKSEIEDLTAEMKEALNR